MKKFLVLSLATLFCIPCFIACNTPLQTEKNTWQESDLNGDSVIDEKDYELYEDFSAWQQSENATDYNGDRKINFNDYTLYVNFNKWKISDSAFDYNGDKKITMEDYSFYSTPQNDYDENGIVDEKDFAIYELFITWINGTTAEDFDGDRKITYADYTYYNSYLGWAHTSSAIDINCDGIINPKDYELSFDPDLLNYAIWNRDFGKDYNSDGIIDEKDYAHYIDYKEFTGTFRISNFKYENDHDLSTYIKNGEDIFYIENLKDLYNDITLTVSDTFNVSCKYGERTLQQLKSNALTIEKAFSTCVFEKLSDYVSTVTFSLDESAHLVFTLYLSKNVVGYISNITINFASSTTKISFNLIHVDK